MCVFIFFLCCPNSRTWSTPSAYAVAGAILGVLALPFVKLFWTDVLAVLIGLTLGIRAGLKPNSVADHSSMLLALVGLSLPNFVIGATLMIVLALQLGWLPVAGWGGYEHLLMPALTLALPYAAYVARLARSGTIDVMQQDFIRTARAKGLPGHAVILKHALKGGHQLAVGRRVLDLCHARDGLFHPCSERSGVDLRRRGRPGRAPRPGARHAAPSG